MTNALQTRTELNQTLMLKQLKKTPIIQICCEKLSISRSTYYRWRENKKFAQKADKSLAEGVALVNDMAESQLLSAIRDRNISAIFYWLNHRHPAYGNKLEVTTKSVDSEKLTEAEKELVTKALRHASILQNNSSKGETHDKK